MTDALEVSETHRLIASDRVEGTKVYNKEGEKLGTVIHFMVDKRSGNAEYAVLEFGGLLGIGSDHYPIPWKLLDYDEDKNGYVVDIDKSQLENAPRYNTERPEYDHIYGRSVFSYYGIAYPFI